MPSFHQVPHSCKHNLHGLAKLHGTRPITLQRDFAKFQSPYSHTRCVASAPLRKTTDFRVPPHRARAVQFSRDPSSARMQSGGPTSSKTAGEFSYKLSAAYCGKQNKFIPTKHNFSFDSSTSRWWRAGQPVGAQDPPFVDIPSGQDSCFVGPVGATGAVAFGIADGVGGWIDQGIDSGDFARGLCFYMEDIARTHGGGGRLSAQKLLETGYTYVCHNKMIVGGGSTACIAVADSHGRLNVANLGDSGFMQLRLKRVHYQSEPQTHAFNTPYQLSQIPPKMLAQIKKFGGKVPMDMPSDAAVSDHDLQHGDILVFGTDGVWDNLSSQNILEIAQKRMGKLNLWIDGPDGTKIGDGLDGHTEHNHTPLQTLLATDIAQAAKDAGLDRRRDGPFAKAFQKAYPREPYHGGKPDDIAVIVAIAIKNSSDMGHIKSKL